MNWPSAAPSYIVEQGAGLCGAVVPGALWLSTGLHTGSVGFTVEVHDQARRWIRRGRTSWRRPSGPSRPAALSCSGRGDAPWELDLEETDYRVRYCARGMDEAHRQDTRLDDEPQLDCYLL